jgi:hypothetical protein
LSSDCDDDQSLKYEHEYRGAVYLPFQVMKIKKLVSYGLHRLSDQVSDSERELLVWIEQYHIMANIFILPFG